MIVPAPGSMRAVTDKAMTPREYGEYLADQAPRITRKQAEAAARILSADHEDVPRRVAAVNASNKPLTDLVLAVNSAGNSYRRLADRARSHGHRISHAQLEDYASGTVRKAPDRTMIDALAAALDLSREQVQSAVFKQWYGYSHDDEDREVLARPGQIVRGARVRVSPAVVLVFEQPTAVLKTADGLVRVGTVAEQ